MYANGLLFGNADQIERTFVWSVAAGV